MKIDIHTHTRKCKSGDAATRDISSAEFCEAVLATDVGIIAITNHNVFDLHQYREIEKQIPDETQVWPGIELDILEGSSLGHLLVIVSPVFAEQFAKSVEILTSDATPDAFTASVDDVLGAFGELSPLYVAHYKQKKPNLSDDVLQRLEATASHPNCVIKEVTNSISAGIYISHGHASIYGSDVQDWAMYEAVSRQLPDLRLAVDSFEHFCLLLRKDPTAINTTLNKKNAEDIVLLPFDDGTILKIRSFDDINIVFGPKGTGKTCILKAIAKYYAKNGIDASVYESASDRLNDIFDIKGKDLTINLNDHGINYCTSEIEALREAGELTVTSLAKYLAYFTAKTTNSNAKKILLKDMEPEEERGAKREFKDFQTAALTTESFLLFLSKNTAVKKELDEEEHTEVARILSLLGERLSQRAWDSFSNWKETCLLNSAIRTCRNEIERKTGTPAKPTTTGFRDYARNRISIEVNAREILKNIEISIPMLSEHIGSLGSGKGDLEFMTEFQFQNGNLTDSAFASITNVKKSVQKKFIGCVWEIKAHACSDDLFQWIAKLNELEDIERVKTVYEMLLFKRYFSLDGNAYVPSSGEASMVMLEKELGADKDVYILDEPERSLGNEYISDVIVPLIKGHARAGKKVFISTHDANIAVRTLPYNSIYRCHEKNGYRTYIGNPFSNNLVNVDDNSDQLDWKQISMKTLEGGEEAFGERGQIYGNN